MGIQNLIFFTNSKIIQLEFKVNLLEYSCILENLKLE